MCWYEFVVETDEDYKDRVAAFFHKNGSNGVLIEDNENFTVNKKYGEYLANEDKNNKKNNILVKGYFTEKENVSRLIKGKLDFNRITLLINKVKNDWEVKWKEGFKKIKISDSILVKPSWDNNYYNESIQVSIDPGMAFGTGSHETTILCIKFLEKYLKSNMEVVDLGCGSGILSIIASKLNAKKITAIDIDSRSVEATIENCKKNKIKNCEVLEGEFTKVYFKKPDLIVSNILYDILIKLLDDIISKMTSETIFISSGIIKEKKKNMLKIYEEKNLKVIDTMEKGEWISIVAKKKF